MGMFRQTPLTALRALQVAAVVCGAYLVFIFLLNGHSWSQPAFHYPANGVDDKTLQNIQNDTLGFEHVYAIGLKERTDKRDFVNVAASVSGFRVEWVDGVQVKDLQQKALPAGYDLSTVVPTIVGCWRAHMNALNKILENAYSTALIFEDDADWDVNLKSQLQEFARGLHALKGNDRVSKSAPYGTEWDILWIGGCSSAAGANETQFYVIPEDPTVPSLQRRHTWGGPLDAWKENYPEDSSRFIYRAGSGCCTFGYAVTQRGAKKILASLSLDHMEVPVDIGMSELCAGDSGRPRVECYAPFPNLVGTYRFKGPAYRNSDVVSNDDKNSQEEHAENMIYSTRRNIHRLVSGERTVFSQWGDEAAWSPSEINLEDFSYPRGFLVSESSD